MNRYRKLLSVALQLCPVVLLVFVAATSATAQKAATGPSTGVLEVSAIRNVNPPPVPENLRVDQGFTAFLVGHAVGTQNYVCKPSGAGFAFALFTPQATLFSDNANKEVIVHFFSPNPD